MSSNSSRQILLKNFAESLRELFPNDVERMRQEQEAQSKKTRYEDYWNDPFALASILWPSAVFADYQKDIVNSVWENNDTIVVAGNMLGKDYIAGFIVLVFFLTRTPCRIVTTSADGPQLEAVLWGEIRRFIQTSTQPLNSEEGGPLHINHLHLRKVLNKDGPTGKQSEICSMSYVMARVAAKGEGMLGHHVTDEGDGIPRTLVVADEASGVDDESWNVTETWAERRIAIGNPWNTTNFFKRYVKEGNVEVKDDVVDEEMKVEVESNEVESVEVDDE